ncbi:unnamed protein product [Camellia sinensis]
MVPRALIATGHQEDDIGDATLLFSLALLGPRPPPMGLCCCCSIYYYVAAAAAIITFFTSSAPFNKAQPQSLVAVVFPTNGDPSPNPVPVVYLLNGGPSPSPSPSPAPAPPTPPSPPHPLPPSSVVVVAPFAFPSPAVVLSPFLSPFSPANSSQKKSRQLIIIILGSSLGVLSFVVVFCFYLYRKKGESEELEEFYVDQVLGMPTRFSYKDLRAMTCNFNDELGKRGFGSVFQGKLSDGANIAVKRLNVVNISDFGLSKLIDKDQSQVVTMMKGTLGYLASKWVNSIITEKVDVYSFGVVVLEMLCGCKNLDWSQPKEDMHLLSLFKRKAEEEQLLDIVDKYNDDMQIHREEVVKVMRVAMWCLQSDFSRSSSMSVVVKVLEGSIEVENNLDYNFTTLVVRRAIRVAGNQEDAIGAAAIPLVPSILSGPR